MSRQEHKCVLAVYFISCKQFHYDVQQFGICISMWSRMIYCTEAGHIDGMISVQSSVMCCLRPIQIGHDTACCCKVGKAGRLTLVDFSPESMLESFFGLLQLLLILEAIQVGQNPHDFGEPMHLCVITCAF